MNRASSLLPEGFPADSARVRLFARMNQAVVAQSLPAFKGGPTHPADIVALIGMDDLVESQTVPSEESHLTQLAAVGLVSRVLVSMHLQSDGRPETFAAHRALVREIAGVQHVVVVERELGCEVAVAFVAFEERLALVVHDVELVVVQVVQLLPAGVAQVSASVWDVLDRVELLLGMRVELVPPQLHDTSEALRTHFARVLFLFGSCRRLRRGDAELELGVHGRPVN